MPLSTCAAAGGGGGRCPGAGVGGWRAGAGWGVWSRHEPKLGDGSAAAAGEGWGLAPGTPPALQPPPPPPLLQGAVANIQRLGRRCISHGAAGPRPTFSDFADSSSVSFTSGTWRKGRIKKG
jgi:hypothetical protein